MKLCIVHSIVYLISILSLNIRATEAACGKRLDAIEGLIRYGLATHPGDWPWHAAIFVSNNYQCGGTLLNYNSVLTAAHCVFQGDLILGPERFLVGLGMYDLRYDQHKYKVLEVDPHPEYTTNYTNDIAILRLAAPVTFTNYIQPICLWNKERQSLSYVVNQIGTVIGWGITETGQTSDTIKAANIPVLSQEQCKESDPFFNTLTTGNFCGGYINGTTLCKGDSGSSLSFLDNDVYRIRGIVSYYKRNDHYTGCNPREFVVFTDVAQYLQWIESIIGSTVLREIRRTPEVDILPSTPSNNVPWPQVTIPTSVPQVPQGILPNQLWPQVLTTIPQVILPNQLPWPQEPLPPQLTFSQSMNAQQASAYHSETSYNQGGVSTFQQAGSSSNSQQSSFFKYVSYK